MAGPPARGVLGSKERPLPLDCPTCRARLSLQDVFDGAFAAAPERSTVTFRCPACEGPSLARLADGLVETLRRGGSGAPEVVSFELAPDLAVAPRRRALRVWLLGQRRDVPVARDLPARPAAPRAAARRRSLG